MSEIKIVGGNDKLEIVAELFKEYKAELNVDISFQAEDITLEEISKIYGEPEGKILLAEIENQFAGCVAFHKLKDSSCELKRLFVRKNFRGFAIGKILMQKAIEAAKNLGYKEIYLDTLSTLKSACRLYEKLGFEQIEPYYHNPLENVVYYRMKI